MRRRSAKSDILVQSSFGLADALKAELLEWVAVYLDCTAIVCEFG